MTVEQLAYAMLNGYTFRVISEDTITITSPENNLYTIKKGNCNCPASRYNPSQHCKHEKMTAQLAKFIVDVYDHERGSS